MFCVNCMDWDLLRSAEDFFVRNQDGKENKAFEKILEKYITISSSPFTCEKCGSDIPANRAGLNDKELFEDELLEIMAHESYRFLPVVWVRRRNHRHM